MIWYIVALVIVLLLVLVISLVVLASNRPEMQGSLVDKLSVYQNWKTDKNEPYSFSSGPTPGTMQIAFYDDRSYMKGITVFLSKCDNVTANSLSATPTSLIQSPYKTLPRGPWHLQLFGEDSLVLTKPEGRYQLRRV